MCGLGVKETWAGVLKGQARGGEGTQETNTVPPEGLMALRKAPSGTLRFGYAGEREGEKSAGLSSLPKGIAKTGESSGNSPFLNLIGKKHLLSSSLRYAPRFHMEPMNSSAPYNNTRNCSLMRPEAFNSIRNEGLAEVPALSHLLVRGE